MPKCLNCEKSFERPQCAPHKVYCSAKCRLLATNARNRKAKELLQRLEQAQGQGEAE